LPSSILWWAILPGNAQKIIDAARTAYAEGARWC
jgi:hypothetical protein